jgi:protein-tyrosine phosphatase
MVAEFAMKSATGNSLTMSFNSAGTHGYPGHPIRQDVLKRLKHHGIDASRHQSRFLTQDIINKADVVVAMSTDHQKFIKNKFNKDSVLFLEITEGQKKAFPDLWEVVPDYQKNKKASEQYVNLAIDKIIGSGTKFISQLPKFIP